MAKRQAFQLSNSHHIGEGGKWYLQTWVHTPRDLNVNEGLKRDNTRNSYSFRGSQTPRWMDGPFQDFHWERRGLGRHPNARRPYQGCREEIRVCLAKLPLSIWNEKVIEERKTRCLKVRL